MKTNRLIFLLPFLLIGCHSLPYKGTIQYIEVEGGFFGIVSKDGDSILPLNLDEKLKKSGTVIEYSGEYNNDMMTLHQWGKPFIIKDVKIISTGNQ